ncbi:MAG: hypothetical protein ACM3O3_12710 [Syntrophothermus sp.]
MIALHCGYNEYEIGEMTYGFYKDVMVEIGLQLHYDSVVPLLGRDYGDEKTLEYVNNNNPVLLSFDDDKVKPVKKEQKVTISMLKDFGMFNKK